jgi:hypothetical protein
MDKECGQCGKQLATPLRCSRCRARWYCSPECQRTDWPKHKSTCHPPAAATAPVPQQAKMPRVGPVVEQVNRVASKRDLVPDPAKFPSRLRVFAFVPSPDGLNENLLILLHGLGKLL